MTVRCEYRVPKEWFNVFVEVFSLAVIGELRGQDGFKILGVCCKYDTQLSKDGDLSRESASAMAIDICPSEEGIPEIKVPALTSRLQSIIDKVKA